MNVIGKLGQHNHPLARQCANLLIRECAVPRFSYLLRGVMGAIFFFRVAIFNALEIIEGPCLEVHAA